MAVNAFTLFGEITVDTRKMQQALRDANKAIKDTKKEMDALNGATSRTTSTTNTASSAEARHARALRDSAKAAKDKERAVDNLGKKIGGVGDKLQSFGTDMTYLVTAPIAAAGAAALKSAIDFQRVQNQVNAAAGSFEAGAVQFERLIAIARTSPGVFLKSSASAYALLKQMEGLSDPAIEKSIKAMGRIKLANPEFDATEFARNLNQLITQGFEAQDVKQAMGRLPSFGPLMAEKFKLSGSDYTTVSKEMRKLVQEGKLTGDEFMNALGDAVLNHPIYSKLDDTLGDKFLKTFERIELALKPIGDRIGAVLLPALTALAGFVEKVGAAFALLSPEMQNVIIGIAAFVASIGPVAAVVGTLIGIFGALIASIKTIAAFFGVTLTVAFLPFIKVIAIVVAAVAALAAIAYVAYKAYSTNFAGIADVVNQVGAALKDLAMVAVDSLQGAIRPILASLTELWDKHGDTITWALGEIIKGLGYLVTALLHINIVMMSIIGEATRLIGAIVAYIIDGFSDVIGFLKNFFNAFDALLRGDFEGAYAYVIAATESFSSLFTHLWGLIPSIIIGYLRAIFPKFDAWFTELANTVREWANRAGGNMGTAIVDGMVSAILGGSGRVASALINLVSGGGGEAAPTVSAFDQMQADRNKRMMKIRLPAPPPPPRFGGGGGGGGGASKEVNEYQQALDRINDTIARFNAVTNEQNLLVDIAQGKFKKATEAELALLKERNRTLDLMETIKKAMGELDSVQQNYTDTVEELDHEIALLNATTEEERLNIEMTAKKYAAFSQTHRDAIRERKEYIAITNAQREAEKLAVQAQLDANNSLLEFVNLNAPAQSNVERLNFLLLTLKMRGVEVSDSLIKAATSAAAAADILKSKEEAFQNLSSLMQALGMETDNTKVKIEQLKEALLNTDALQQMAQNLGITIEELRAKINFEISEAQMPTFAGQWRKQLDAMREKTKNFTRDVAGTLATSLFSIGDVFGQAVAEWDGTAKSFFQSLARSFQSLIQDLIAQLISLMVARLMAGLGIGTAGSGYKFKGVSPGNLTTVGPRGGSIMGITLATGGLVTGPGTAMSDSIPAMLSNGEFVIPASSVKKFGVDFFESLRKGQMPMRRYAMGGAVMPSASSVSTSNSTSNYNNVFNISVPGGGNSQQTSSMVQGQILKALRKHDARNK